MRGLLGAATVIGCLKYGAGVCGVYVNNPSAEVFLKDGSLNDGPDDEAFLLSLRRSLKTARGVYPPVVFFLALCCLGKIPGGTPFSQLHKSGNGSRVDRP